MLNSRNLSALLTLNVTQYAQTLLILTPTGQTLAYSSPSTLKTLRPTAAVAASTYISYNAVASNGTVAATLRDRPVTGDGAVRGGGERERVESVSVEFEGANLVVEWIKEGLLFAVLGPVAHP
ncbi:MAG: hypothetical protein M1830_001364, partial [Pleopsidium flavum]